MSNVIVVIPKRSSVNKKVRNYYTELWTAWKKSNPLSRAYPISKLNANIRNALSVNGKVFEVHQFKEATITKWAGRKVLPYSHWFFLVNFQKDLFGNIYAIVEDACYEGDYHNDTMNTQPYGESRLCKKAIISENKTIKLLNNTMKTNKKIVRLTESVLKQMIVEAVQGTLMEVWDYESLKQAKRQHPALMNKIDPRTYANRARGVNAQGRPRNDDRIVMRDNARYRWNDEYGFSNGRFNKNGEYEHDSLGMHGNHGEGYNIDRQLGKSKDGKRYSYGDSSFYNPNMNKTYNMKDKSSDEGCTIGSISDRGSQVARQMAKSNGKYIPNKGCQ